MAALQELEELKQIVPKESLVYFLIGKVYKKLGQTHLALMNFSWAMDLDPKGANNQIKEAIDKRYLPEDEAADSQDSSIMTDADDTQLHTAESDDVL
nr:cell division cycle protein 27 homolog [Pseudochaenichthys georgianus]